MNKYRERRTAKETERHNTSSALARYKGGTSCPRLDSTALERTYEKIYKEKEGLQLWVKNTTNHLRWVDKLSERRTAIWMKDIPPQ